MRSISIVGLSGFFLIASLGVNAQSYSGPESVEHDAANNRYLVSNTNSGQILADDGQGNLTTFATGIASGPHGLEIVGNTVYACSGGSLLGFDLTSGSQTVNVSMGASFLNGITSDGSDYLFLTDFSARKIYRFNIATEAFNEMASHPSASPNGIVYDGANNRLVFVEWGNGAAVNAISLSDSSITTLANTSFSNIDGVVMDNNGNFYICPWSTDAVYAFNNAFTAGPSLVASGMNNPADMGYNATGDTIGVPNSGNNTVTFIDLSGVTGISSSSAKPLQWNIYADGTTVVIQSNTAEAFKPVELVVYDLSGKQVMKSKWKANKNGRYTTNLNGTFIAELRGKGQVQRTKLHFR